MINVKKVYIVGDKDCSYGSLDGFGYYINSVFSKKKDALKACCSDFEKVIEMKVYENFEEWDKDVNQ